MFTVTEIELDFPEIADSESGLPKELHPNAEMISNFRKNCEEMGMYE